MADITKVQLGVCSVNYNGYDLGHTLGGVEYTYAPAYKDLTVDAYGKTIVDQVLTGEKVTVKVALAEYTIANLKYAMPNTSFAGAGNTRVTVGTKAGKRSSANAYQLVLHPTSMGTKAYDIILYKAVVASTIVLKHTVDTEKVIEVTFEAMVDETKSEGNYLGMIGDSTT